MRINFIKPALGINGGTRVVATYARLLQRRGHEVTVVATPGQQPGLLRRVRSYLRGQGWPQVFPTDLTYFAGSGVRVHVTDRWRPVVDRDVPDADVTVATWWETAEWVAALSPSKGAKAYFIQGYEVFPYLPADRVEATWRLPLHKITISQWLAGLARDRYGDDRVDLVPNGVDFDLFHAPPRGKQAAPTVGVIYTLEPFKGCDIALEAFRLAAARVPGLRLRAFGHRRNDPGLPLPAGTEYVFEPAQASIRDIYSGCDAWLFGGRSEGFGLPILEAMACRTPVIGTPAGAAPELLAGGGGVLVPAEDPAAMARAIEQVCTSSEDDWRRMSDTAYTTARGHSWEDAADAMERALRVAVERAARGEVGGGQAVGVAACAGGLR